ncbi:M23 family metallopeptidase [Streptomyces sp. Qhu_M48]|uniref:M23 family metallopeptidase n=1 Tax=Streptomyces sp. Qhu_M48 TaxID=3435889 RepID=UPI003F5011D4
MDTPGFTEETSVDCGCAGCADAVRHQGTDGARTAPALHGVRRAVVATVGAVALAGAGAGTAAAEPAPAHAGWDGSKYWFRSEAGEWRWTSHATVYERRRAAAAAPASRGEPVFRGRRGWDARDHVYWYESGGHWYWTGHAWKYRQRTGLPGDTSERDDPRHPGRPNGQSGQSGPSKPSKPSKPSNTSKPSVPSGSTAPPSGSSRGWTAPVSSYVFTGYYGQTGTWSKGYHTGQDFAVPTGTAVRSVGPGRVVTAGYGRSYGYEVVVRHPDGRHTQYAHLSRIEVSPGQSVSAGQRIARSGATGRVTGPHLHFEVRTTPYFGSDVDPLAYLRAHGVPV